MSPFRSWRVTSVDCCNESGTATESETWTLRQEGRDLNDPAVRPVVERKIKILKNVLREMRTRATPLDAVVRS